VQPLPQNDRHMNTTTLRNNGWLATAILVAAYAVSFLDRQVVSLLVEPIKHDLMISNTQIGILQGPAFGLFYAALGLPLGWFADRTHRVRMIAGAITLWSLATLCCGLATSYPGLVAARLGVGVGEAALVPAAISLLAELFAPEKRALPVSIFNCGVAIGAGLALTLGGTFIAFSEHGASDLPLIGEWLASRQTWPNVFVLCGLVGLPVALLALLIAEPARQSRPGIDAPQPLSHTLRYIVEKRRFFLPMLGGMACFFILSNALTAWLPTLLRQQFNWTAVQTGHTLGLTSMPAALLGNICGGLFASRMRAHGHLDATLLTILAGLGFVAPASLVAPLLGVLPATLICVAVLYFGIAMTATVVMLTFVEVAPSRLRGQLVAIYLLVCNIVGLSLGPVSVGRLMDSQVAALSEPSHALAIVCVATSIPALLLILLARQRFAAARVID
jgi:MFS family permease